MIEKTIEEYSGEFTRIEFWNKLPKKVMWQTYIVTISYLQSINKIAIDSKGKIGYIRDPELAKKYTKRKSVRL